MSRIAMTDHVRRHNSRPTRWPDRLARQALHNMLGRIEAGTLFIEDGLDVRRVSHVAADPRLQARIVVQDGRFYRATLLGGSVGAAEAYMNGWWSCSDLTALVRILLRSREVLDGMERGWARISSPLWRVAHALRRNDRRGSRRNIAAHYDLGNDFFAQFLDETMTYSCGIFEHDQATMAQASSAKLERLCRKLQLTAQDHVLEIGSGWGSFALHAARHYGCRVTTTTISRQQYEEALRRVQAAGLENRVTVLLKDYRDLQGRYDKLVSIEMIEAVGHQFYGQFFASCAGLLKPDGHMALQAITIADAHYERARRAVDFIKRHVFPGCCIPSVTALLGAATKASDLQLFHLEDLTPHYAETLRRWRQQFLTNRETIQGLGYEDPLLRMWEFYLCYCEGSFEERYTGTVQMILTRPQCRRASLLPALAGASN